MKRHFTADPHYWHKGVIEKCKRPWATIEEMNAGLIANWNAVVADEDEVYILGDWFFCGTIKAREILIQLKGKKRWILGNHDWGKIKRHRAAEFGIDFMVDVFCIRLGRYDVQLSHFPYKGSGDHTAEERYIDHRLEDKGGWLLHGHVHHLWQTKGRQINVGVDVWNYAPVSEHTLIELMNKDII